MNDEKVQGERALQKVAAASRRCPFRRRGGRPEQIIGKTLPRGPLPLSPRACRLARWRQGGLGMSEKRAFWKNEPKLKSSRNSSKWLIDNNLRTEMGVVKKRQLEKRTQFGLSLIKQNGHLEGTTRQSQKDGGKIRIRDFSSIFLPAVLFLPSPAPCRGMRPPRISRISRIRKDPFPIRVIRAIRGQKSPVNCWTHIPLAPRLSSLCGRGNRDSIRASSGLNPSQSDLIRLNPTNWNVFYETRIQVPETVTIAWIWLGGQWSDGGRTEV